MQTFNKRNNKKNDEYTRYAISVGVCIVFFFILKMSMPLVQRIFISFNTKGVEDISVADNETIKALTAENESLKKELGRTDFIKGILATVITNPNKSLYDTLILDGGTDQGIVVGQHVYGFDGVAIGIISSVLSQTSTVKLFSAPNNETTGNVGTDNTQVTLIGRGAGEYEIKMPRDVHFALGDIVTTQTMETHVVGSVEKILVDPRDPFQILLVKIPLNLQNLKWVLVK